MATQLIESGHRLLCISRTTQASLQQRAAQLGVPLEQWSMDLAQGAEAARRLEAWLVAEADAAATGVTLINNAAALARIGPFSETDADDLVHSLRLGLEAPMLLTAAFLRATESWPLAVRQNRKVLSISSGLGRRAMASQAAYCAVKAGLDHFTRCVALDEAIKPHGARLCSLAPGVIDTDMQVQLRATPEDRFPDRASFVGLKDKGLLTSPAEAAARVLVYLAKPDFGAQPVADVRDPK
jgi:benzil reductase ((S)-benzoin forming)